MSGFAVIGVEGEEEGAQHTALRCSCIQYDVGRPVYLSTKFPSAGGEVTHPAARACLETQMVQFNDQIMRRDGVKGKAVVNEQQRHIEYVSRWSMCVRSVLSTSDTVSPVDRSVSELVLVKEG